MIETLEDVRCPAGEGDIGGGVVLDVEGGFPPGVLSASPFDAGVHAIKLPGVDPRFESGEASRGPSAVQHGENKENAVAERVFGLGGVFGEIGGLGVEEVRWPSGSVLNEVKEVGEPFVDGIGKEGENGGSKGV